MGSCGVLPSLVYHFYHDQNYPKKTIIQGLKVAGLIGNLIQTNATISGAKAGCQAEVGAACSMGAAFVAYCQLQNHIIWFFSTYGKRAPYRQNHIKNVRH